MLDAVMRNEIAAQGDNAGHQSTLESMMADWLMILLMALALPFAVCALFAAGMLFLWYTFWAVGLFGSLIERLIPALKDHR